MEGRRVSDRNTISFRRKFKFSTEFPTEQFSVGNSKGHSDGILSESDGIFVRIFRRFFQKFSDLIFYVSGGHVLPLFQSRRERKRAMKREREQGRERKREIYGFRWSVIGKKSCRRAVSYTHLTLPTKRIV